MNKLTLIIALLALISCNEGGNKMNEYLTDKTPENIPMKFKPELTSDSLLIHSGIFSPDMNEYYYTLSDKKFSRFDVKVIKKENGKWSEPKYAFFNTKYFEHGTSFSPNGKFVYFSSTRPTGTDSIPETWHIWRCQKVKGEWSEPKFIDVPNMRDKLVSHPSITSDGTLYFHAGATDYSVLEIYSSKQIEGKFQKAVKLPKEINMGNLQVTPYISPDESFIIFYLPTDLYISYNKNKQWLKAKPLNKDINNHNEGNPFITPDNKYLFYAAGSDPDPKKKWDIYWVSTDSLFIK